MENIVSIIVTGATSMIGSTIVDEALAQSKNVTAIVRRNARQTDNLLKLKNTQNLQIIECDMNDYKTLNFDAQYDAFFHLAWQSTNFTSRDDVYAQIDNVTCTVDAIHAAKRAGCRVFVNAGSQAEYGFTSEKLRGDMPCNPESGYGIAKFAAGRMVRLTAARLGIRYCHTRILSTYGKGMDDGTLIVYLIRNLLAGEKPSLTKCEQLWDFLYVQDTARAMLAVAEKGIDGKTYPIGSGIAKPLREYVETVRDIMDSSVELGFGEKDYYPHQPMFLCADIDELREDTGFEPSVVFEDGIRMTIDWVKASLEEISVSI